MKRAALFIALLLVIALFPAPSTLAGKAGPADLFDFSPLPDASALALVKCKGSLEEVQVPDTFNGLPVAAIGEKAFYKCDFLKSVTLPEGLKAIGDYAFWSCKAMTAIALPPSLETIGKWAFVGCDGLVSIRIPALVSAIGDAAFSSCKRLEAIEADSANVVFVSLDGVLINTAAQTLIAYPGNRAGSGYVLPEHVQTIGVRAFAGSALQSVTLTEGLTAIAESAFYGCEKLRDAVYPNGLKTIGPGAFNGCRSLLEVYIPTSVENIAPYAYRFCDSLKSFRVDESSAYFSSPEGVLFDKEQSILLHYPAAGPKDSYALPATVQSISHAAFMNCGNLKTITLPDGLTEIGADAFRNCGGLKKLAVPSSVVSIGKDAFTVWEGEIILQVRNESYAQQYAAENLLKTEIIR